jgi:hypothetical protein
VCTYASYGAPRLSSHLILRQDEPDVRVGRQPYECGAANTRWQTAENNIVVGDSQRTEGEARHISGSYGQRMMAVAFQAKKRGDAARLPNLQRYPQQSVGDPLQPLDMPGAGGGRPSSEALSGFADHGGGSRKRRDDRDTVVGQRGNMQKVQRQQQQDFVDLTEDEIPAGAVIKQEAGAANRDIDCVVDESRSTAIYIDLSGVISDAAIDDEALARSLQVSFDKEFSELSDGSAEANDRTAADVCWRQRRDVHAFLARAAGAFVVEALEPNPASQPGQPLYTKFKAAFDTASDKTIRMVL